MTTINYKDLVANAKSAARDVLRSEKVNALIGYIANVNTKIESVKKSVEEHAKSLARVEYELRIATHFESPDLEDIVKTTEAAREDHAKFVAEAEKTLAEHAEKIAEYNTKIEKWQTGESKVDLDRLNELAMKYVKDKVGTDFNMGLYSEANKN